jgi:UDP-N-acetylglucosamine transferase subunit ALG13
LIYVTVGTHNHPFTRLVKMMDEIAGEIDERVVIQIGPDTYVPQHAEYVDFVPRDVADACIREARLVIAQPGCGIIATAISMGKPLLLVPRRPQRGEIIDDHQVDMARALDGREGIRIVYDEQNLRTVLDFDEVPTPAPQRENLFDTVSRYLDQLVDQKTRRKRRPVAALFGVLALALILRLWGIGWGLPNGQTRSVSYHPDENTYLHHIATANPSELDFVIDSSRQTVVPYTLAALLASADAVGWFELQPSEDYYIAHPEEAAKIYLLGRFISLVTAALTVVLLYWVVRRSFPDAPKWLAPLGALFLAVVPGHVINSHYLETDIPVTFLVLLTVCWMVKLVELGRLRDYFLVGISTGLAINTKWSALPLLPLLAIAHCMRQPEWRRLTTIFGTGQFKRLLVLGLALTITFFLTNPYAALHPTTLIHSAGESSSSLFADTGIRPLVINLTTLLIETLPTSLGWGLYLLGVAGLVYVSVSRRRTTMDTLALLWVLLFGSIVASTEQATIGRTSPLIPFLVVLAVSALARLRTWAVHSRPNSAAIAIWIALSVSLALGVSIVTDLFFCCSDTARQDSSHWILENAAAGSTFGLYDQEPYWDDPDVLYQDFYHPSGAQAQYGYEIYPLDMNNPPKPDTDYLIFTDRDALKIRNSLDSEQEATLMHWMEKHYEVVAEFESTVSVLGLEFHHLRHLVSTPYIQILRLR